MIRKKGFTLSEIMIAMVVLGIIIAACVPVIMNMSPNKNAIMIKKAYYTTEQIVSDLINDPVYYPYGDLTDTTTTIKIPGTDIELGGDFVNNKFACLFASKLNLDTTQHTLQDICQYSGTGIGSEINLAYTQDGMVWNLAFCPEHNDWMELPHQCRIDVSATRDITKTTYSSPNGVCIPFANGWGGTECPEPGTTSALQVNKPKIGKAAFFISLDGNISLNGANSIFAEYGQPEIQEIIDGTKNLLGK